MSAPKRVLIYARGTAAEIIDQQDQCQRIAELITGYEIVSVAADPPNGSDGWISANSMLADGEVDRIMISSRDVIPRLIESVTRIFPRRRPRRLQTE